MVSLSWERKGNYRRETDRALMHRPSAMQGPEPWVHPCGREQISSPGRSQGCGGGLKIKLRKTDEQEKKMQI